MSDSSSSVSASSTSDDSGSNISSSVSSSSSEGDDTFVGGSSSSASSMDLDADEIIDDDDDDDIDVIMALIQQQLGQDSRLPRERIERMVWEDHAAKLERRQRFQKKYHMTLEAFEKLINILGDTVSVDKKQSMRSSSGNDPISSQLIVACGIRFLGGELPKSLEDVFGIDISSVTRVVDKFLVAVDNCPTLDIRLPRERAELDALSRGFSLLSQSDGLFNGCIGALDGWLCCTTQPREVTNKRKYYSGHYRRFGLNIQAACDHKLRFIFFALGGPGKRNDSRAIQSCVAFQRWLPGLKANDFFLVADNAYLLSDQLLIPYSGKSLPEDRRTYNFFLSQLHIRIELAFGCLTTKWRIFRRDLDYSVDKNAMICRVAAKLHNYVINCNEEEASQGVIPYPGEATPRNLGYLLTHHQAQDEEIPNVNDGGTLHGVSILRDTIVNHISRNGITRPDHNRRRNG